MPPSDPPSDAAPSRDPVPPSAPLGHDGRHPLGPGSAALVLLTIALWGGTPVAIKFSTATLPPVATAGIRFAMAVAFMAAWCAAEGIPLRLRPGELRPACIGGVLLCVQIGLFHVGVHWSNASHGTVLLNTFVFWVVAIEHFVTGHDRLTARKLCGLLLAAAGAGLLLVLELPGAGAAPGTGTSPGADRPGLAGDLALLASGLILAVNMVYTKRTVRRVEPGRLVLWHDVVATVLFAAWSLSFEQVAWAQFTAPAVWALLYQGVLVAGLCFGMQARLLRRHSASSIAVFGFATPLFGIGLAVLLRGDRLSPSLLVSGACVAAGILTVTLSPRPVR